MRKLLLLLLLAPLFASAQSPFDGTWKIDYTELKSDAKPMHIVIHNGILSCTTCTPPFEIKADGQFQKTPGDPVVHERSVTMIDAKTVKICQKREGKETGTAEYTVSPDGKTLTIAWSEAAVNGPPVTGQSHFQRVSEGPSGAHAVSGEWADEKLAISENGLLVTMATKGDMLTLTRPTGEHYTAKFDGPEAPFYGDPGITTVAIKRLGPNMFQQINKLNGETVFIHTAVVEGKTMKIEFEDLRNHSKASYIATRQ